jgi:hypothetical protein
MLIPLGFLAGSGAVASDYELIETQILGSSTPSITFSNLGTYSSTYKHLQIRAVTRSNTSGGAGAMQVRLNGDTGANYAWHRLGGYGSNPVQSGAGTSQTFMGIGFIVYSDQPANVFGASVLDILDPYSTTKNKTVRSFAGVPNTIELRSGAWFNTNSVTSVLIKPDGSETFAIGSRFSLYGIKG